MTALDAEPAPSVCPICRQHRCSLLDVRDRLAAAAALLAARRRRYPMLWSRITKGIAIYLALLAALILLSAAAGWA